MHTTRTLTWLLALAFLPLVLLALSVPTARAADPVIRRVSTTGTTTWPCGDQSNWSNSCALQTALTRSVSPSELWVAAGTYTPTAGADRTISFQLKSGVALYGGFAGLETARDQRDFTDHATILSGDINVQGNASDNSFHVVTGSGVTNTAVLDGFTITGGNANDYAAPNNRGGGMYNYNSSGPTLANVTFSGNSANFYGGGMSNYDHSSPTLTNVTFSGNSAHAGVGQGGGIANDSFSSPSLTNVTFSGNSARYGGGLDNYDSSNPTLTSVTFISNTASSLGGGMNNHYFSSPSLTDVTFSGNSSDYYGGGMYNVQSSHPTLTNITFSGNSANWGGGMYNVDASPTIRNAILWGNSAPNGSQIFNSSATPSLYDSVVQGGCPASSTCTNIITADPRLGVLGNYGGSTQTVPILPGSSAIDAGNDAVCPPTDQRGIPRPQGPHCDIGAFEAQIMLLNLPLLKR